MVFVAPLHDYGAGIKVWVNHFGYPSRLLHYIPTGLVIQAFHWRARHKVSIDKDALADYKVTRYHQLAHW
jgi:hypothetical protein